MKVLVQLGERLAARVAAAAPGVETVAVPADGPIDPDLRAEVLLTYAWGAANLADVVARAGVRWIHTMGTGVDGFPLAAVGDRLLTCSRGASAIPIAEWVLAQMLAFEKQLPAMWRSAPPADPNDRPRLGGLHDRRLGLVGVGGIGAAVATRALAFSMRVRALRRTARPSPVPGIDVVTTLPALLADADHVVIAAPATPATRHLIDAAALGAVKRGVHLVNVARGALVDQDALRSALDDGRVALASLDAAEPDPPPAGHWLYAHPKVHLSAHVSWSGPGATDVIVGTFVENLRRWRAGEPLLGLVNVAEGY